MGFYPGEGSRKSRGCKSLSINICAFSAGKAITLPSVAKVATAPLYDRENDVVGHQLTEVKNAHSNNP